MAIPKEQLPIIRQHDPKKELIIYRMEDKRLNLPAYRDIKIDGTNVMIVFNTGETRHLPPLDKGYRIKKFDNYQLVFEKIK